MNDAFDIVFLQPNNKGVIKSHPLSSKYIIATHGYGAVRRSVPSVPLHPRSLVGPSNRQPDSQTDRETVSGTWVVLPPPLVLLILIFILRNTRKTRQLILMNLPTLSLKHLPYLANLLLPLRGQVIPAQLDLRAMLFEPRRGDPRRRRRRRRQ